MCSIINYSEEYKKSLINDILKITKWHKNEQRYNKKEF
jgi:hypothetical protein